MDHRNYEPIPAFGKPMTVWVVDGGFVISGSECLHAPLEPEAAWTSADRRTSAAEQAEEGNVIGRPLKDAPSSAGAD